MPTYDFLCPNGHRFEKFYRKISLAPSEETCPECGAAAARQVSGGAGLLFKGSGFYITDYGKDGKKAASPPVKESKDTASGASEGKSESKPAESPSKPTPKGGSTE